MATLAVVIDLVAVLLVEGTVLALHVAGVTFRTFLPHLFQEVVEALVLELASCLLEAVRALHAWRMVALAVRDIIKVFFVDAQAIETLPTGRVRALRLVLFFGWLLFFLFFCISVSHCFVFFLFGRLCGCFNFSLSD